MSEIASNVFVIPPRRKTGKPEATSEARKMKVAAYCRVSTDSEEQESSYLTQVSHYTEYINSRPDWELVGVYADDGISGTSTAKRSAFNQMILDCEDGKIDMVITKSISRFSRNTLDCLRFTRKLKERGIAVFFEKENINTLDAKGEVLLTIMASLAQQESESLSANVRMGIQFRNQQGKVRVNHNRFLGYTKDEDGNLIIDEEQARIVRRIYREYLEGASVLQIRRGLEADGIENGAGHTRWYESNILQILTNEKYIGDALLQKTYTVDLLAKKRAVNEGQRPQYYVEGCHEAIIDKEVFFRVQTEIERRANFMPGGKRRIYSGKYALSSVLFCGHCGDKFRRIKWNIRGRKTTVWRCASRVEHADCPARTIKEEALHGAVVVAVYDAYGRKAEVIPQLKQNIREVVFEDVDNRMEVISEILSELQQKLIDSPADGDEVERIGGQIEDLRREQQDLLSEVAKRQDLKDRMNEMIAFIEEMPDSVTGYSDTLVRRLIEKIVVYDKKIEVQFKSGLKIEVEV